MKSAALIASPGAGIPVLSELAVLYPGETLMENLPSIYQRVERQPDSFLRALVGVLESTTQTLDARISRTFHLTDSLRLAASADAFNIFNHRNDQLPNATFGTGTFPSAPRTGFGQATAVGDICSRTTCSVTFGERSSCLARRPSR